MSSHWCATEERFLAVADGGRLRVLSLENGKEILKLSNELVSYLIPRINLVMHSFFIFEPIIVKH